jgi:hypothetical protein
MALWKRSWTAAAATAVTLAAIPGAILVAAPTGIASADVCANGGGPRVQVSGCANIADAVAPYVPPPAYYAPMPYDPPPPPNVNAYPTRHHHRQRRYPLQR